MKKNSALFSMIAAALFVIVASVILLVFYGNGAIQLEGVALGAGFGFWLALGFMVGRAIYGERKNVVGLIAFMLVALIAGLVYQFAWQLPYIRAHRTVTGLLEQVSGMMWALSFAAVYLSFQDYRRAGD